MSRTSHGPNFVYSRLRLRISREIRFGERVVKKCARWYVYDREHVIIAGGAEFNVGIIKIKLLFNTTPAKFI